MLTLKFSEKTIKANGETMEININMFGFTLKDNIFKVGSKLCTRSSQMYILRSCIINFMGHDLAIIVMRNLFFISLYGIDMDVIHLFVLFEHQCCVHFLDTNVICLFILFKHECCMFIRVVYTQKLCT
jgi:hypothetical protein